MTDLLLAYSAASAALALLFIINTRLDSDTRAAALFILLWPVFVVLVLCGLAAGPLRRFGFRYAAGRHIDGRRWGIGRTSPHPGFWLAVWGRAVFVCRVGRK